LPRKNRTVTKKLMSIYNRLLNEQGHQGWWPADGAFEVAVGAVLTQNTSWRGASKAVQNLISAGKLDPHKIHRMRPETLARLLVPAGYFNLKARRLKSLVKFLLDRSDGDPSVLIREDLQVIRDDMLDVWGVGPETVDSILLYACGHCVFVVDAYTRRIFSRLGMFEENASYEEMRSFFEKHLEKDVELFKDYHAQIVRLGHEKCRPKPLCSECCLRGICPHAEFTEQK